MRKLLSFIGLATLSLTGFGQVSAPIHTPQVNSDYYVGVVPGFYPSIQSAVTATCALSTTGSRIIIPAGSAPTDTVAAVTGGCTKVSLSDQRVLPANTYSWVSTSYVIQNTAGASFPATSGLVFNTSTSASRNAVIADITHLFTGSCITTSLLQFNGQCGSLPTSIANVTGGTNFSLLYQSAPSTTTFLSPPTLSGVYILTESPSAAPIWQTSIQLNIPVTTANNSWTAGQNFIGSVQFGAATGFTVSSFATSSANVQAADLYWTSSVWNGSSATSDSWVIAPSIGIGSNPSSILDFTHTGPGISLINMSDVTIQNSLRLGGSPPLTGISGTTPTLVSMSGSSPSGIACWDSSFNLATCGLGLTTGISSSGQVSIALGGITSTLSGFTQWSILGGAHPSMGLSVGSYGISITADTGILGHGPTTFPGYSGPYFSISTVTGVGTFIGVSSTNPSVATSGNNYSAPAISMSGAEWSGASSVVDTWAWTAPLGTGSGPTSTYTLTHTGSPGVASVSIPYAVSTLTLVPTASTAPSGSCSGVVNGTLELGLDGHAASCNSGTWTSRW
jgi:hypothetical protein